MRGNLHKLGALLYNMYAYIQEGLVNSFSIAFITIIICFLILLKSLKFGLLAIIPSLMPIVIAGGIMGISGIYLDFATMMVAAITFGIAVDDTIHFMTKYLACRNAGDHPKQAIRTALTETGRALVYTSLILFCGFSILLFSSFMPNVHFGIFVSVIIIIALIADLVLLPAVMLIVDKPN